MMRTTTIALLLACCASAVPAQKQSRKTQPAAQKSTLAVYPVQHLGKEVEPLLPWLRAFAGQGGSVQLIGKPGHLLIKADRAAHKRAAALIEWAAVNLPLELEVTVTAIYGDAEALKALAESTGPILASQAAVTKLLRAAERLDGVRLKNFPTKKSQAGTSVVRVKLPKAAKQVALRPLAIGATALCDGKFLAKTWSPGGPCVEMQVGQTLVVGDVSHGCLVLVKYDKLTAKQRSVLGIPIRPVVRPGGKRRPR